MLDGKKITLMERSKHEGREMEMRDNWRQGDDWILAAKPVMQCQHFGIHFFSYGGPQRNVPDFKMEREIRGLG